eukprot:9835598-Prorocentrum_lima.AAC.1
MEMRKALIPGTFIKPNASLSLIAPWRRYSCHYSLRTNDGPDLVHPNTFSEDSKKYIQDTLSYSGVIPYEQLQYRLDPANRPPGKRVNAFEVVHQEKEFI